MKIVERRFKNQEADVQVKAKPGEVLTRITPSWWQFVFTCGTGERKDRNIRGMILQKLSLNSFFNPFPLSGWTIPPIFNYMNDGLGSKQSLPISWVLWTERVLENVIFPISVQLPNPIFFSFQSLWVLIVHQNSPFSTHHLIISHQNSGSVSFLITPQLPFLSKFTCSLSYSSRILLSACLKVGNAMLSHL